MELFELYLSPIDEKRFQAIATQSPTDGDAESCLPFWDGDKDWRTTIIKTLESEGGFNPAFFPSDDEQAWMVTAGILTGDRRSFQPTYLKTIGQALYQALFPPNTSIRDAFQTALRFAERDNVELHLRLKFSADSTERSRLADYPWELIHDGQRFLQHRLVQMSRYIAYEALPPHLPTHDEIQVLLVSSRGTDEANGLRMLSDAEQQAIRTGLSKAESAGLIKLTQLPHPTRKGLSTYLTECDIAPQVLHFDGHGVFGKQCSNSRCRRVHPGIKATHCKSCGQILPESQGFLVFEDEQGQADYISATSFASLLSRDIALIVLSACQSGMAVAGESVFNGTAQQLIDARFPAVVAMQYAVLAKEASEFVEQFYRVLGRKNTLLVAINEGRKWMGVDGNQWYRPVLYLRWQANDGGQLFDLTETRPSSGTSVPGSPYPVPGHGDVVEVPDPIPVPQPEVPTPQASGMIGKMQRLLHTKLAMGLGTGAGVAGIVLIIRIFAGLQPIELDIYDRLLTLRPAESADARITVIEATEADLSEQRQAVENFGIGGGISVDALVDVFELFQQEDYQPAAIALDLYRDFQEDPQLADLFRNTSNLVGLCETGSDDNERGVLPPDPTIIPRERVGFSNFVFDTELFEVEERGKVRRQLISLPVEPDDACQSPFSFGFLAANHYLEQTVGDRWTLDDEGNLVLGDKTLPRMATFSFGGYQYVDTRGIQVMLNYRSPRVDEPDEERQPLRAIAPHVSIQDVRAGKVSAEAFKDKVVLIGITAPTEASDVYPTPYGETVGVTIQAHMISHLLSAAIEGDRPAIWVWSRGGEALWILAWGLIGGIIGIYIKDRRIWFLMTGLGGLVIIGTAVVLMTASAGWIPVLPPVLTFVGAGFIINYRYYGIAPRSKSPSKLSSKPSK